MGVALGADLIVIQVEEFDSPPPTMFSISEEEQQAIHNWIEKHREDHKVGLFATGAIGGRWTYEFTPTGLGVITIIRCNLCKAEKNVTDFDSW